MVPSLLLAANSITLRTPPTTFSLLLPSLGKGSTLDSTFFIHPSTLCGTHGLSLSCPSKLLNELSNEQTLHLFILYIPYSSWSFLRSILSCELTHTLSWNLMRFCQNTSHLLSRSTVMYINYLKFRTLNDFLQIVDKGLCFHSLLIFCFSCINFTESLPQISSLIIFYGLSEEVGPIIFGLGLVVHGDHDPLENFISLGFSVFDFEFGELKHIDLGGSLDSFFAYFDVFFL